MVKISESLFSWFISDDPIAMIFKSMLVLQLDAVISTLSSIHFDIVSVWVMLICMHYNARSTLAAMLLCGLVSDSQSSLPGWLYTSSYIFFCSLVYLSKEHLTWHRIQTWMSFIVGLKLYIFVLSYISLVLIQNTFTMHLPQVLTQIVGICGSLVIAYVCIHRYFLKHNVIHEKTL